MQAEPATQCVTRKSLVTNFFFLRRAARIHFGVQPIQEFEAEPQLYHGLVDGGRQQGNGLAQ